MTDRLERIDAHFRSFDLPTPEGFLNMVGYNVLWAGKPDEAVEIFEINVSRHPASANVYDSLGDGYDAAGRFQEALENYEKAVRRAEDIGDPRVENFRSNLERMRVKIEEN